MPTSLALALTFIFIAALYVWHGKRYKDASSALWLPVLWVLPAASRFPSQWLNLGSPTATSNVTDGSTTDATYFSILIALGAIALLRRRVVSAELLRKNFWLVALLVFGLASILWSDFSFIAMKRWIKALGHPIMALIILTELKPAHAFRVVMMRCAFILVPVSVLFIKYMPQYGRYFNPFDGSGMYRGAMITKNELGVACVFFGLFFLWRLLARHEIADRQVRREETAVSLFFLGLIVYLLVLANSAASLVNFAIGAVTLIGLGLPFVSKRFFGTYFVVVVLAALAAELGFSLYGQIIEMLGKDPTLTDRTLVWADVIELQPNPLIGVGFESFWLGDRLEAMWAKWWWQPNQAHNGYIETYLNLGLIGLSLLVLLVISAFRKITAQLSTDFEFSRLRMALLFAVLTYNITEATFRGVALSWTMFHLAVLVWPRPESVPVVKEHERYRPYGRRTTSAGNLVSDRTTARNGSAPHYRSRLH